jgi:hypothetical protein
VECPAHRIDDAINSLAEEQSQLSEELFKSQRFAGRIDRELGEALEEV